MSADGLSTPFLPPEPERTLSARTWMLAAFAVLLLVGVAAIATLRRSPSNAGGVRAADPYAGSLPISNVSLSEATNGAGGKSTYVDGTIANTGAKTVTGATLQLTFHLNDGATPYRESVPLALVRTRVPYVDLEPVSAAPLAPGGHHDFRLIFESVPPAWDEQPPAIQIVHTELK